MQSNEFNSLFTAEFAEPLIEHGFKMVGRGSSMHHIDDNRELLILRQGGRLARQGMARSVICFRHTFLRPIESDDPAKKSINVEDCPRKLTFDNFDGWFRPALNYRPENSGRWRVHDINYAELSSVNLSASLRKLRTAVIKRVLPWTQSLTAEGELSQIKRFGENAWCEQRWIEDYENFLSHQNS
jgi:hypothetical protein